MKKIKFTENKHDKKYNYNNISKYNYDKKISKLLVKTKIYLTNIESKYSKLKNEEFYSIFGEVKDNVIYY